MSGPLLPSVDAPPWRSCSVGPGVRCLLAPNPGPMTLDGTNTWLLTDHRSSVVIDPGPADESHLHRVLDLAQQQDAPINEVLLTHHHADHSAGAARLRDLAGGISVRALDPAYRLGPEGFLDGDVVSVGDRALRVVATPGHTGDSLSLVLETAAGADLFTGDTVLGRGTSVIAHPDGALGPYLTSLARLRGLVDRLGRTRVLPGHGPLVADGAEVLQAYQAHRAERLEQVRVAVADGAHTVSQVVDLVYRDIPPAVRRSAELSVAAQLAYLRG